MSRPFCAKIIGFDESGNKLREECKSEIGLSIGCVIALRVRRAWEICQSHWRGSFTISAYIQNASWTIGSSMHLTLSLRKGRADILNSFSASAIISPLQRGSDQRLTVLSHLP